MTKTAKTITYAAGIFTAFWLIIAFLITSVEAVTYWTPGYYEKEYTKYQVLNDLPEMTMDDLLDVTDQMMAFLRGKREDLHVYTTMGGEYREFFNDREIAHMEDVQGLFIGGLWLRRIGILITLCFAALAYFRGRKSAERTEALKRLIPKSPVHSRHRRRLCFKRSERERHGLSLHLSPSGRTGPSGGNRVPHLWL